MFRLGARADLGLLVQHVSMAPGLGGAVLAAVIGAVVGSNLQKRNESDVYRTDVRLDSGSTSQFDCCSINDLLVADRIQALGGQWHRVRGAGAFG